jgi:hypothetical protein
MDAAKPKNPRVKNKLASSLKSEVRSTPSVDRVEKVLAPKIVMEALKGLLKAIPEESPLDPASTAYQLRKLREQISVVLDRLQNLLHEADPVKHPTLTFDPADANVVGELIANTLLLQPRQALGALNDFYGSGVYALYYNGPFQAYSPLVGHETPIYVGKADPASSNAATAREQGTRLRKRLAEHAKTISSAKNLSLADFEVRYLVVRSAWQGTAEHYLIDRFRPVWNKETKICYGFGKHGDSATTRKNKRSPWDTLHMGRKWAAGPENLANKSSVTEIQARIAAHFSAFPPATKSN